MSVDFSFWIDADSCPPSIRDLVCKYAKRISAKVFFVANRKIPFEKNPLFSMIVCENTQDAADSAILANASVSDLVVTRDIPLASKLVARGVVVLNDRGDVWTEANVKQRLALRNLALELAESGVFLEKSPAFSKKDAMRFADALDREVQKKLRASSKKNVS